jgi:flagellar biosynthesis/type III secretory pathway chaperone
MRRVNKNNFLTPVLYTLTKEYNRQLIQYKRMLKLAEEQREYTQKEDITKVEEVILARQELINQLDEMNNKLKPLKEDIKSTLGLEDFSTKSLLAAVPSKAAEDLAEILEQLGKVLYTIKELDAYNEGLLREKLSQVNTRLNHVQQKNKARKAYSKKPKVSPQYIDENK